MSKRIAPILATRRNMRDHATYGLVSYDRYARIDYSATDGDYWTMGEDQPLTGMFGKPLILAVRAEYIRRLVSK